MRFVDLYDASRDRPIPVALYPAPEPARGSILFSVGFGGGRQGYAYLGRAWSQLGFDVAVVEHVGSNLEVLKRIQRPGMRQSELALAVAEQVKDPAELQARPLDLLFVQSQLFSESEWCALAGHSFGSYTCLAALGAETRWGQRFSTGVQWRGTVLMSVQPPDSMISEYGYSQVQVPALLLTGTRDSGMPAGVQWEQRLLAYQALPPGCKWSAVLQGADHMAFAAVGLNVAPFTETVASLTGEFWEAVAAGRRPCWPVSTAVEVQIAAD